MASLSLSKFKTSQANYSVTVTKTGKQQFRKNGKFVKAKSFNSAKRHALKGSLGGSLIPSDFRARTIFQFSNLLTEDGRAKELLVEVDPRLFIGQKITKEYRRALAEMISRRRALQVLEFRREELGLFDDEDRGELEQDYLSIDFAGLSDEEKSALFRRLFGS
jgi:hypothetical protein